MNWTTSADIKAQLNHLWGRGELLRHIVSNKLQFPLRLRFKKPDSAALAEQFDSVRVWVTSLTSLKHIRIEWREFNHRMQGTQRLPQSIWIDQLDDALRLIEKKGDTARFTELLSLTRTKQPALLTWLDKRPLQALELADQWEHLLSIVEWMLDHPHPDIYLRQVDISGIHSKFLEKHRTVISELLDLVLPPEAINSERTGINQFASRYGFLDKPARIRFRVLDENIQLLSGPVMPDITMDAFSFTMLNLQIQRIFITENETNFLAFPPLAGSIVIFGSGYGWDAISKAEWLVRHPIYYWGDIDTHGFAILNQLRTKFNHVLSFLMDRQTLMTHEMFWGEENTQVTHDLLMLTTEETVLYNELRDNRIRKNLRLEQERVGFKWIMTALENLKTSRTVKG